MPKEPADTLKKLCPTCGKPSAGGRRAGSLTAFMFGGADCTCGRGGKADPISDDSVFCPKCGLKIEHSQRDGSLTGFLFQSTRCKCPRDKDFAEGNMSSKFWKLKEADAGTIFLTADTPTATASKAPTIGLAPGAIIGGAYEIIELIGRGGMGEVYLARHKTLGKKCALKVIPPEQVTEMGWQRFQLEAKAVAKLDHVNLVKVTDLGIHDGCLPFYAMDHVDGSNLADLLASSGPMPLQTAIDIFIQICDGVDNAHRNGILHRDLKPANIMVMSPKGGKRLVKILDFGLAKLTTHDRSKQSLTAIGDVFGSPFYMSPEQCNGDKLDRRSDIYSIGCTLFECLTGQPPFTGHLAAAIIFSQQEADPPTLAQIARPGKFPPSMEIIIAKLLRKNPVERYQTLLELRDDLLRVARGETVQPYYVNRGAVAEKEAEPETRADNDRSGVFLLIGALSLVLLVGATAIFFLTKPKPAVPVKPMTIEKPFAGKPLGNALYLSDKPVSIVRPKSVDDTTPFTSIEEDRRRKVRVFNFPTDFNFGTYRLGSISGSFEATGVVKLPEDERVVLQPSYQTLSYPGFMARFRQGDLWGVRLEAQEKHPSDEKMLDFLQAVASVPGITLMEIFVDDWHFGEREVNVLDKLTKLETLRIGSNNLEPEKLSRLKRLKQLEVLHIRKPCNLHPILERLSGSTHLVKLNVTDSKVSVSDLKLIAGISSLKNLELSGFVPATEAGAVEAMNCLSKCPNLRTLLVDECNLSEKKARALAYSFKSLREFRYVEPTPDGAGEPRSIVVTAGDK